MANYNATTLTNYFSVKDEAKFRGLIDSCSSEDEIEIFEETQTDGSKKLGFGCYGTIDGISKTADGDDNDDDADLDAFYNGLQSILCENDAILITEIGREKLRYVVGACVVITSNDIKTITIWDEAIKLAKEMLGNDKFDTKYDY